jgi:hypothetical protein
MPGYWTANSFGINFDSMSALDGRDCGDACGVRRSRLKEFYNVCFHNLKFLLMIVPADCGAFEVNAGSVDVDFGGREHHVSIL